MQHARKYLHALVEALLSLAAPSLCAACDELPRLAGPFCSGCEGLLERRLEQHSVAGVPLRVAGTYASPLSDAIRRFKYESRPDLARPLSRLVAVAASELGAGPGVLVVPVPLHPRRLAERGYNQAALLAAQIARHTGARCSSRALVRQRYSAPQVGKSRAERIAGVAGVFAVRRADRVRGASVVLVDDVATTGSTLSACIEVLEHAGARVCGAVALARASEVGMDS